MTPNDWAFRVRNGKFRTRSLVAAIAATTLTVPLLIAGPSLSPAYAAEQTFTYTGTTQSFSIPEGVTAIQVTATGASGGTGANSGKAGGKGAVVTTTVAVTPFQVLYVNVGGQGADGGNGGQGGFNGNGAGGVLTGGTGGGGGGATDLRFGMSETDRVVVAGGGGGGGAGSAGGLGGDAVAAGTAAGNAGAAGSVASTGGNPGTVSAPGSTVTNGGGAGDTNPGLGTGGLGGDADSDVGTPGINGGGGGGGGWHGASGGGSDDGTNGGGGGGGAGSSHAPVPGTGAPAPTYSTAATAGAGSLVVRMIQISTVELPQVHVGQGYAASLASDDPGATWSVSPSLWTGLTLTAGTGAITGTVAALPSNAAQYFTFTATNATTGATTTKVIGMAVANGAPDEPTEVSAVRGNQSALVSWVPAATGSASTGYRIEYSTDGGTGWQVAVANTTSTTTSREVTGLTNGLQYLFRVSGVNAVGVGLASDPSGPVTPATVPGAPTGVVVDQVTDSSARVTLTPPASNGGDDITSYTVTSSPSGIVCEIAAAASPKACVFDGSSTPGHSATALTTGVAYTFTAVANNSVGASAQSTPTQSVTTGAAPDAPANLVATRGNGSVELNWDTPESGGAPITGYRILKSIDNGLNWTTVRSNTGNTDTWFTATGLANGTSYVFAVLAVNSFGWGAQSDSSNAVTPAAAPGAPTGLAVTAVAKTSATVKFSAPASDGGQSITNYTVTATPGGIVCTLTLPATPLECQFDGAGGNGHSEVPLTEGTSYTFTATATNEVGTSPASSATPAVVTGEVPGAPADLTAERGNQLAELNWEAPASNGAPITGYRILKSTDNGTTWSTVRSNTGNTNTWFTAGGLVNGTSYVFAVVAVNSFGWGGQSANSNAVTPAAAPGAPTGLAVSGITKTSATVTFNAPASNGGESITSYTVTASPGGIICTLTLPATPLACQFDGAGGNGHSSVPLSEGTSYTFTATATNAVGTSVASGATPAVVTGEVPDAPTGLTAKRGNETVELNWEAPADNGAQITGYRVQQSADGGASWLVVKANTGNSGTQFTVTGLANGTGYSFRVQARNDFGWSLASDASEAVIPATVPGAPKAVLVGNVTATSANVSFTAPDHTGGLPITSYTVITSPAGTTCTTNTTWCNVTGLTTGVVYTFTVVANNELGASAPSSVSRSVTSSQTPSQVTGLVIEPNGSGSKVHWYAPVSDGGSDIDSYTVYRNNVAVCTVPGLPRQAQRPSLRFHCLTKQSAVGLWTVHARSEAGTGAAASKNVTLSMTGETKGNKLTIKGISAVGGKWVTVTARSGSVKVTKRVKAKRNGKFSVVVTIKNPKQAKVKASTRGANGNWIAG